MVQHAARSFDAHSPTATLDAAMAKRFATDSCHAVANDALQLLGGYGFLKVGGWARAGWVDAMVGGWAAGRVPDYQEGAPARVDPPCGRQAIASP